MRVCLCVCGGGGGGGGGGHAEKGCGGSGSEGSRHSLLPLSLVIYLTSSFHVKLNLETETDAL